MVARLRRILGNLSVAGSRPIVSRARYVITTSPDCSFYLAAVGGEGDEEWQGHLISVAHGGVTDGTHLRFQSAEGKVSLLSRRQVDNHHRSQLTGWHFTVSHDIGPVAQAAFLDLIPVFIFF